MFYTNMQSKAKNFLAKYENKNTATSAAAYQAIGGLLILDGFFGMPHPLSGKKRTSIFGNLAGIIIGVLFLFAPTLYSHTSQAKMTSVTTGKVTEVSQPTVTTNKNSDGTTSTTSTCKLTATYTVEGKEITQTSTSETTSACKQIAGNEISVNYDPKNPGSWDYDIKGLKTIIKYTVWLGVALIVLSSVGFIFRLFTIWFGWRLIMRGRSLARKLPNGGNLASMISNIKKEFSKNIFGV